VKVGHMGGRGRVKWPIFELWDLPRYYICDDCTLWEVLEKWFIETSFCSNLVKQNVQQYCKAQSEVNSCSVIACFCSIAGARCRVLGHASFETSHSQQSISRCMPTWRSIHQTRMVTITRPPCSSLLPSLVRVFSFEFELPRIDCFVYGCIG